jgi:methionine synthase I (cobalamin-dependent)
MGTRLAARGLDYRVDDASLWCLTHPELVLEVHQRDIQAGADVVMTNTFGANRKWLERFGQGDRVAQVNRAAVKLARRAAGDERFVFGSIGPSAVHSAANFREQTDLLITAGVDALVIETLSVSQVGRGFRRLLEPLDGKVPIMLSFFDWHESSDPVKFINSFGGIIVAFGYNCHDRMDDVLEWAGLLAREEFMVARLVKPNAGSGEGPPLTPADFGAAVPTLVGCGVKMMGGCCGTTEAHLAAMRSALEGALTCARFFPCRHDCTLRYSYEM